MKSKSEITDEYIDMINDIDKKLEQYEDDIKVRKRKVTDQTYGNRKIEDIEDEIENIIRTISNMRDECRQTKRLIQLNENNF